jgi:solute:Na+ symporter, SSS family
VTGLAFMSANLGAIEIMGMSANGAEVGLSTMHYYWIGAVPAMLFLGVVMMPFYYGSKVRSVPEFMRRRFGPGAHLVNAISFATAQVLIAGVNLFLLATVINVLVGWPRWVSLIVAAGIVLSYILPGGLSAAIYNEVLQFFVIPAALVPLTTFGLIKIGGWNGLKDRVIDTLSDGEVTASVNEQLTTWPGQALSGFDSPGVVGDRHRVRAWIRVVLRVLDNEFRRSAARDGLELDVGGTPLTDHRGIPEDVDPVRDHRARHDRRSRDR